MASASNDSTPVVHNDPVVKVLKKAKRIIADPQHWTKGAYARNAHGTSTYTRDAGAVAFCSLGAINKAMVDLSITCGEVTFHSIEKLRRAAGTKIDSVITFNDDAKTTHTDVMVAFDKAIRLAEGKSA